MKARLRLAALIGLGVAIAIAAMELAAGYFQRPLGLIPFVTSIVLVLALPEAEPARPRALVGGHLVASLCGYAVLHAFGSSTWTIALAVGLSAAAMHLTRTMHPPAGIDPLLVVHQGLGLDFLIVVVMPGALLLAVFARAWARLSQRSAG
jgi:CBS-domain-containing membrane protein